ncbi:MAG TPA: oxidoreductase [Clostridiales bacterium]|nr:oxidoreductase [Clostridiales bacterium]
MKRFRIASAGCGAMSRAWLQYTLTREDTEIVALVDPVTASANARKEEFHLDCAVFSGLQDAIKETGANLVFDITPPEFHKPTVLTALRMGCDVFGEKPMSDTLEHAREMKEAARKSGRLYAVMQNRRYHPQIIAFRDLLQDPELGAQGYVCADFFLAPHFGGFRDAMDSPLILDMAIHTFDAARYLTGANAKTVYCQEFNPSWSWYRGDACAVCIFEMTNGSIFVYRGSWCSDGMPTSWESEWRISCAGGTALWNGRDVPVSEILKTMEGDAPGQEKRAPLRKTAVVPQGIPTGHPACLEEMFSSLLAGREPQTSCYDNYNSIAMVFGAIESARTGQKVGIRL